MNKVITVNLNGNGYPVEERGYELLCEYLDAAEAQLKGNPDQSEIISDLEQAIADRCRNFLGPQKTIVSSAEIEQILQAMGPVDSDNTDPAGAGATAQSQSGSSRSGQEAGPESGAQSTPRAPRRLYRIREGQQIEGVCTGLAAYLGMDVTVVRLIFVGLAILSGGIAIGAYFVMVLVVPYAETSEEHASAYGMPFNAQDFINQAKEHYSEFKKEGEGWKQQARQKRHQWQRSWRRSMRSQRRRWGGSPVGAPQPMGALTPFFGLIIGILSLLWLFAVISVINTHAIFGWPLPLRFPGWVAIVLLLILLNIVIGPFKFMRDARCSHPYGPLAAFWASLAWITFLGFVGWMAYQHSTDVHNFIQNLPDVWDEMLNR